MTDKLRDAAQLALEALEYYECRNIEWEYADKHAITALRAALAQQDAQDTDLSESENNLLDTLNDLAAELEETRTALAKMVQCSKTMNLHQCADASQHAEAVLAKRPYLAPPEGDVVVTFNESMTRILFVTRQDEEGRIIKVIAEAPAQQDAQAVPHDPLPHGWSAVQVTGSTTKVWPMTEVQMAEFAVAALEKESAMLNAAPTPPAQAVTSDEYVETACALIKAADDAAADRDYMLDSDDCIKVLRGQWKAPLANDHPTRPQPAQKEPK